jgi:hypothetical protein
MRGKLTFADIGAGGWTLETRDGSRYSLDGDIPKHLANKTVEVDGKVQQGGGFGFMMSGDPVLVVRSIKSV